MSNVSQVFYVDCDELGDEVQDSDLIVKEKKRLCGPGCGRQHPKFGEGPIDQYLARPPYAPYHAARFASIWHRALWELLAPHCTHMRVGKVYVKGPSRPVLCDDYVSVYTPLSSPRLSPVADPPEAYRVCLGCGTVRPCRDVRSVFSRSSFDIVHAHQNNGFGEPMISDLLFESLPWRTLPFYDELEFIAYPVR